MVAIPGFAMAHAHIGRPFGAGRVVRRASIQRPVEPQQHRGTVSNDACSVPVHSKADAAPTGIGAHPKPSAGKILMGNKP